MLSNKQVSEVLERVEHFVDLGNKVFSTDLGMPEVLFTKRGTTGGTAWYAHMELNFNAGLMVDNWDDYMNSTIPHEVAHLIKEHIYGRGKGDLSSHGAAWQEVMRGLGVDPCRTHNMDVSKVQMPTKKFIYACEGCKKEFPLSAVRHNRMMRGTHNYRHCNGHKLTLKKALGAMSFAEAHNHKVPGFMQQAAQEAKSKKAKPKKAKTYVPNPQTIIGKAVIAYKAAITLHPNITRKDMIAIIVDVLNVTEKRAGQIYPDAKKKAGIGKI